MMKLKNLLFFGVCSILVLFIVSIIVASIELYSLQETNSRIIQKDWVKANAVAKIRAATIANGASTYQLLIANSPEQISAIQADISKNKTLITDQIEILRKLIYLQKGRDLLASFVEARTQYVETFSKVVLLVSSGQRDEANSLANKEISVKLLRLRGTLDDLAVLQDSIVVESNLQVEKQIRNLIYFLWIAGGLSIVVGLIGAHFISRLVIRKIGGEPTYVNEVTRRIAEGDLNSRIDIHPKDDNSILYSVRLMRNNLRSIIGTIRSGSDVIALGANQIATGNLDLSSRTEEQASSLEETAAAMEQLHGTVQQNAENAESAKNLVLEASKVASKGGAVVAEVVTTMRSINDSSKKIVDIIAVIDGIAFQTNILALNAAVEAARAGEQGRGFAVVASEVRSLAQRSAAAAKEIKVLIDASVEEVDSGTKLVDAAGVTMEEIVNSVQRVSEIMIDISSASREQSQGIGQANEAITHMDGVTQQNAALVEEAAAAASSLLDEAKQLVSSIAVFKLEESAVQPIKINRMITVN
ncbi:MCP four helix bundle domain-containing protein [Undibacterium sp. LX40W]|uniref:MCP four helix bundle domain-containing protein n=2 Tax=Undibacterium TaxID=401469 RepID=A0A923KS94_9BURK|nr:methyl-accepting chemotaxis protein [Undibacterium nitidum]MBC3880229.1 MCP four helix bundle domain-containing protein [Undibacterium nitidum]MBC3891035.1 MCP four helix bundle domain-containing protein [Undibacterium sp. LX40W]